MTTRTEDSQREPRPLAGVRVLDLAAGAIGAIGRGLAELGADVVRLEPPGGGSDRLEGPSVGGVALAFAAANIGKRAIALDLANSDDLQAFDSLAAQADILIEAMRPGSPEANTLNVAELRVRYPGLVVLSVSDFGQDGAYAGWQATDAVIHALSGELSRSGIPGRAPLLPPGELAIQCAAAQAVYVVLLAYLQKLQTGVGDRLDLSLLDAATQALDPGYGIAGSATSGVPASQLPRGRPDARHMYPILPCKDGHVRLCVLAQRQWQGLFEWMGRPEAFADPAFNSTSYRFASPTLLPHITAFFADKTRAEIEAQGQRYRVPAAALLTLEEALASEHIRGRGVFSRVELAPEIGAPFPNGVAEIDGERPQAQAPRPLADETAADILRSWSRARPDFAAAAFGEPGRPLAGLRVLDLGVIVVGSEQGRLLADFGADVIKIENAAFMDGSRVSSPGGMAAPFATGHRNKRGLALNLRDPEGRTLFLKLLEQADVVLSNFKPGTLESLDLGNAVMLARNPRLVLVDSSAFGATGPWSGRMGYGPLVRASAGLTARWRYPDDPSSFSDAITVYPDHVAARVGISCVLALLIRRLRTGWGGTISISQTDIMLSQMAAEIAAVTLTQQGQAPDDEPLHDAPWGVFPCAGDDAWCVVSVRGDADWRALCHTIGRDDLGGDIDLSNPKGRVAQRGRIDEAVGAWLRDRSPHEAMARLQAAGVPAAAMLRVSELPDFEYFQERAFFHLLRQPQLPDPIPVDNAPVGSEHLATPPLRAAPMMGEHTVEIARALLGLADADIARLLAARVLDTPETIAKAAASGNNR